MNDKDKAMLTNYISSLRATIEARNVIRMTKATALSNLKRYPMNTAEISELVAFTCPSFSKAGLMCCFASMKEIEHKTGLRCKSRACDIRLPLDTITAEDVRTYETNVKAYMDEIESGDGK